MKINTISASQLGALALLIVVLMVSWLLLVYPYTEYVSAEFHDLEQLHKKQITLENLLNSKKELLIKHRGMTVNRSLDRVYISDEYSVLSTVKLQGKLKRLINDNNGVLVQMSQVKSNTPDEKKIRLKVNMTGDVSSTYKIFHSLENGFPVMTINDIRIYALSDTYGKPGNYLRSEYEITAYVKR